MNDERLAAMLDAGSPDSAELSAQERAKLGRANRLLQRIAGAKPQLPSSVVDVLRREEQLRLEFAGTNVGRSTRPNASTHFLPPDIVPGYRLERELGRGGMGVVYLAEDLRLHRPVALKFLVAGALADADELARFRREAEAAAHLQHPNIVGLFEVGDIDGRPFLAFEYVPGGSLDRGLGGQTLPPNDAATLVEPLARAIAYAHQRGIVHRDLKPANVLMASGLCSVASESQDQKTADSALAINHWPRTNVKITDFGLAKRLDANDGKTRTGVLVGTPGYMAPEQARGATDVGPAADIYALGAILYECVIGRPPFRASTMVETLRLTEETEPIPPSRLRAGMPRDLETICLKCLAKDPARRYATGDELADDLRRYLDGLPVLARRTPWPVRLGKWARRRPALATLLMTLVVGSGIGVWSWYQFTLRLAAANTMAATQRDRAIENARVARSTVWNLFREFSNDSTFRSASSPQLQQRLLALAKKSYADMNVDVTDDPELLAEQVITLLDLGKVTDLLGDSDETLRLFRQAATAAERLPADRSDVRFLVASARNGTGHALIAKGNLAEARSEFDAAIAIFESLQANGQDTDQRRFNAAGYYNNLAIVLRRSKDFAGAEQAHRRALALREQLPPVSPDYRVAAAQSWLGLGTVMMDTSRFAESEEFYRKAVERRREVFQTNPDYPDYPVGYAQSLQALGTLFKRTNRTREAAECFRRGVEVLEGLDRAKPNVAAYQTALGNLRRDLNSVGPAK